MSNCWNLINLGIIFVFSSFVFLCRPQFKFDDRQSFANICRCTDYRQTEIASNTLLCGFCGVVQWCCVKVVRVHFVHSGSSSVVSIWTAKSTTAKHKMNSNESRCERNASRMQMQRNKICETKKRWKISNVKPTTENRQNYVIICEMDFSPFPPRERVSKFIKKPHRTSTSQCIYTISTSCISISAAVLCHKIAVHEKKYEKQTVSARDSEGEMRGGRRELFKVIQCDPFLWKSDKCEIGGSKAEHRPDMKRNQTNKKWGKYFPIFCVLR